MATFRFQDLELWQKAIEIGDRLLDIADELDEQKTFGRSCLKRWMKDAGKYRILRKGSEDKAMRHALCERNHNDRLKLPDSGKNPD